MRSLPPTAKPGWPPPDGAYAYIQTLNSTELAWELLRRNLAYQSACAAASSFPEPQRLASGHLLWTEQDESIVDARWGLWPFR